MKREFCLCDSKNGEQWTEGVGWSHRFESEPQGYCHPNNGEKESMSGRREKGEDNLEMLICR